MAWKVKNEMPIGRLIRGTGQRQPRHRAQGLHQEPAVFEHPSSARLNTTASTMGSRAPFRALPIHRPASQLTRTERIISRIYTGSPQA